MKRVKISKFSTILIVEVLIACVFILNCFRNCSEYTLDKDDFNQCYDGEMREFHDGYVGVQEQGIEETDIFDCTLRLESGAYSMKILYESFSDYYTINTDNYAGQIFAESDGSTILKYSNMRLRDGLNEIESRFWISWGSGDSELRFRVRYYGNGILAVKSIQIEEKREYRILLCMAIICLMMVCNLIYLYFVKVDDTFSIQKKRIIIAVIVGITFFSSITHFADITYMGHDTWFHLSRIVSLAKAMEEFQIPQRIQFDQLNGYGYAAPLYYGEIFLFLPAILYNLYLPLQTCYQIFVMAINLITCVTSYWCFMRMSNDWKKGLLGAFIYTLAAYRLTCVIVRDAVGEYTALLFFPLLIYGFWSIYNKEADEKIGINTYIPIILAASGIINSHTLSCEMVVIFVVFFVLINYKKTFRKNIFTALMKSAIFSLLLNLWFIIPFLQSMTMPIKVNNKEFINELQWRTAYLSQLFGIFHTSNGLDRAGSTQNEMPLSIGLPITIGIGLFVFVYIKKDEWHMWYNRKMREAIECFVLGMIALFLSSSLCRWEYLMQINKELARIAGMVQYPWRYLGIATAFLTTMIVFLLQILEERINMNVYNRIVLIVVVAVIVTEGHFIMEYINLGDEEHLYAESDVRTNIAVGEYLLQETDKEAHKEGRVISGSEEIECLEFCYDSNGRYYLICNNRQDTQAYIDVPIYAYDNYHAYTEDGQELSIETGEGNKIRINIPGGYTGTICIRYVVPVLWRICEFISLATMCVLIFIMSRTTLKTQRAVCEMV